MQIYHCNNFMYFVFEKRLVVYECMHLSFQIHILLMIASLKGHTRCVQLFLNNNALTCINEKCAVSSCSFRVLYIPFVAKILISSYQGTHIVVCVIPCPEEQWIKHNDKDNQHAHDHHGLPKHNVFSKNTCTGIYIHVMMTTFFHQYVPVHDTITMLQYSGWWHT